MDIARYCTFSWFRVFGPHLLHIFENHVAVSVKGFHSAEQFPVVPAIDEYLCVVLDGLSQDGERSCLELFLISGSLSFWFLGHDACCFVTVSRRSMTRLPDELRGFQSLEPQILRPNAAESGEFVNQATIWRTRMVGKRSVKYWIYVRCWSKNEQHCGHYTN